MQDISPKSASILSELDAADTEMKKRVEDSMGGVLRQLQEAHLGGHVPGLPHGMVVGGRQAWIGQGGASAGPHHALRQQEVAEEAGHQQILHCNPCCIINRSSCHRLSSLMKTDVRQAKKHADTTAFGEPPVPAVFKH